MPELHSPRCFLAGLLLIAVAGVAGAKAADRIAGATQPDLPTLAKSFAEPPPSARPWVYWYWVNSAVTREGITADLEAMQRVGIGGVLLMDVNQGVPPGKIKYMDDQWQEMFVHAVREAKRLGLEFNFNDGSGWTGSGGPWVTPDQAAQMVFSSEVHVSAPAGAHWSGPLPKPHDAYPKPRDNPEYRDIAVLAVAEPDVATKQRYQIADLPMKSVVWPALIPYRGLNRDVNAAAPAQACVSLDKVVDLTGRLGNDGTLEWDVPPGEWTILRIGHAWSRRTVEPTLPDQTGPECDKLSKAAIELHFNAFVKHLVDRVGPDARGTLVTTHIDSWEAGGQNWTPAMREEFQKRRGYDPVPYLPILAGRVLGDLQTSERFLYDLRQTVSELMVENYTAEFQRLAHASGLRNSFESYSTIGNDLDNANFVDEPMAEFWATGVWGGDYRPTIKSMSSAAHINGRSVVGVEAYTANEQEKWLSHPATMKALGDAALCGGVNRFVIHRYPAQPFGDGVKPGVQMGPWGIHYDRNTTWWEFSRPWHEYLARCQYLLRQGSFVADVLKLESEEPLDRFNLIKLTGYDYDACGPASFKRATVRDGRVVFPGGASYRLAILPDTPFMSVEYLAHVRNLVRAGAAVLGDRPRQTPGLKDHQRADAELKKLADELWGTEASVTDRPFGKGRVFRGIAPEQALAALAVPPDFTSDAKINFIHRKVEDADVYFLSHTGNDPVVARCTFRVTGKVPQRWDPETGRITPAWAWSADGKNGTVLSVPFESNGSTFIVFAAADTPPPRLVSVKWNDALMVHDGLDCSPTGYTPDLGLLGGDLSHGGTYVFTTSDGRSRQVTVPNIAPLAVPGPWKVRFPAGWGAPPEVEFDQLISWSVHPDAGVKYFSGTATYSKTLTVPAWTPSQRVHLDLGNVQVMARVRLNGRDLGVLWKPPYRVDITPAARPGENDLEVDVVNLWVNRLIGDDRLPEDSKRRKNGALEAWPQWLLDGKPSPTGRLTFSTWRLWKKDDPLQESGLIGPVTLHTVEHVEP